MKVERPYGKHNRTILCNIPPNLPGDLLCSSPTLEIKSGLKNSYGSFNLYKFMARYMAGNRSLREARLVSRKKLALVESGVGYMDPEAFNLSSQISKFVSALELLSQSAQISQTDILNANKALASEKASTGKIRTEQNWIGAKNPFDASYVCPPPDMVAELFANWIAFVNDDSIDLTYRAIIGHCQLASIHPFMEGNGRTARVFMESLLRKQYGDRVPLMTYRLSPNCPTNTHVKMQELFNVGDPKAINHHFWSDAVAWTNELQSGIETILEQTRRKIAQKIGLSLFSPSAAKLLDYLWGQPIVSQATLMKLFIQEPAKIQATLEELRRLDLIQMRLLKNPQNAVIFDCPIIFEAYNAIDEAIFEK